MLTKDDGGKVEVDTAAFTVGIAVEYARHGDYDAKTCTAVPGTNASDNQTFDCGGTGKDGRTVSLLLSAEF